MKKTMGKSAGCILLVFCVMMTAVCCTQAPQEDAPVGTDAEIREREESSVSEAQPLDMVSLRDLERVAGFLQNDLGGSLKDFVTECTSVIHRHIGYSYRSFINHKDGRCDVYESETQHLMIDYWKDGVITWMILWENGEPQSVQYGEADFVDRNTAVCDGDQMQPETSDFYRKFVFYEEYVELYDENGLLDTFNYVMAAQGDLILE